MCVALGGRGVIKIRNRHNGIGQLFFLQGTGEAPFCRNYEEGTHAVLLKSISQIQQGADGAMQLGMVGDKKDVHVSWD